MSTLDHCEERETCGCAASWSRIFDATVSLKVSISVCFPFLSSSRIIRAQWKLRYNIRIPVSYQLQNFIPMDATDRWSLHAYTHTLDAASPIAIDMTLIVMKLLSLSVLSKCCRRFLGTWPEHLDQAIQRAIPKGISWTGHPWGMKKRCLRTGQQSSHVMLICSIFIFAMLLRCADRNFFLTQFFLTIRK